jgi:nucleoid DNA-binding protein
MNRSELARKITGVLRDNDVRKPISSPRHVFHITDDEGNSKDFVVKKKERGAIYTVDDVNAILDACQYVIEDALRHGDNISVRGFGTLGLKYRKERATKKLGTDEWVRVAARYVPRFEFGNELRKCAMVYEASLGDRLPEPQCADEDGE